MNPDVIVDVADSVALAVYDAVEAIASVAVDR
jgi:hypothetical protein